MGGGRGVANALEEENGGLIARSAPQPHTPAFRGRRKEERFSPEEVKSRHTHVNTKSSLLERFSGERGAQGGGRPGYSKANDDK